MRLGFFIPIEKILYLVCVHLLEIEKIGVFLRQLIKKNEYTDIRSEKYYKEVFR